MTIAQALPTSPRHQLLSLALAALMTAGALASVLGLAAADGAAAQVARQARPVWDAPVATTVVPLAADRA